jgi:hypothetical protein
MCKQKYKERPVTTKQALLNKIDIDKYDVAVICGSKEDELRYFGQIGEVTHDLYMRQKYGNVYLNDVNDEDTKDIMNKVKLAFYKKPTRPIFPFSQEGYNDKILIRKPLADICGIKTGDTARLKIDNISSIEREVEVIDIDGYFDINGYSDMGGCSFEDVFCIAVYNKDLQKLLHLSQLPDNFTEARYTLTKLGDQEKILELLINNVDIDPIIDKSLITC